jgi:hypothetical protein
VALVTIAFVIDDCVRPMTFAGGTMFVRTDRDSLTVNGRDTHGQSSEVTVWWKASFVLSEEFWLRWDKIRDKFAWV